jgi:ArsR family transcriptional regulator
MHKPLRREVNRLHAEICQALSDPTRILILYALRDGARNVTDLAETLATSQPSVSRHLKVLRDRRMVYAERNGMNIYYSIADERVLQALDLLREVLAQSIEGHQVLIHEAV